MKAIVKKKNSCAGCEIFPLIVPIKPFLSDRSKT